jgi:hypothetical protein
MPPEFVLSLFPAYLPFVRDRIGLQRTAGQCSWSSTTTTFLAKCALAGTKNEQIFALWRSLPQPSRVFKLDFDPEVARQRCDRGNRLDGLEWWRSSDIVLIPKRSESEITGGQHRC